MVIETKATEVLPVVGVKTQKKDSLFYWFILHAISSLPEDRAKKVQVALDDGKLNVVVAINGVAVPESKKAFDEFELCLEDEVDERAIELVEDALGEFFTAMMSIPEGVQRAVAARCKKELGLDINTMSDMIY